MQARWALLLGRDARKAMYYNDYYETPGARELCHAVKEEPDPVLRQAAIEEMASYFASLGILDEDSYLVPAPQHCGYAEYMLDIAQLVSEMTGAHVLDIVACEPHEPLHSRKLAGTFSVDAIQCWLTDDYPEEGVLFFLDNMMSSGITYESVAALFDRPIYPLVYAVVFTSVENPTILDWN